MPTPSLRPAPRALLLAICALALSACTSASAPSGSPIKVACFGEQTTHSFHRVNDPEYPLFLGQLLDADFKAEAIEHPMAGGFLYGGGTHYRIGNFGHPRGTVIDHDLEDPKAILRSDELKLSEQFNPDIVILGPFGDHESLTKVSMDHFTPDLNRLIDHIAAFRSHPFIYLALPVPRGPLDNSDNYRRIRDETLQVARARNLPTIDLWTGFLGHPEFFQDGTHLTIPGRHQLAQTVAAAVLKVPAKAAAGP